MPAWALHPPSLTAHAQALALEMDGVRAGERLAKLGGEHEQAVAAARSATEAAAALQVRVQTLEAQVAALAVSHRSSHRCSET